MAGQNCLERRRTRIQKTDAKIEHASSRKKIEIRRFSTGEHEILTPPSSGGTRAGGDHAIMTDRADFNLTSVAESFDSHPIALPLKIPGNWVGLSAFLTWSWMSEGAKPRIPLNNPPCAEARQNRPEVKSAKEYNVRISHY
jgi:hypothetical protein